jgi:hypothetical protein
MTMGTSKSMIQASDASDASAPAPEHATAEPAPEHATAEQAPEHATAEPAPEHATAEHATAEPAPEHATVRDETPSMKNRVLVHEKTSEFLDAQLKAAVISVRQNMMLNTLVRAGFYLVAVALLALLVYLLWSEHAFMNLRQDSAGEIAASAVSTGFPFLLTLLSVGVCVGLALLIQTRSGSEFVRSLDQVSRLRREGTAANTRSLALTQILEETLANARQAFAMQLWISRVLFLVGISLVFAFIISLFGNNPWVSGSSIVTSILALGASALLNPQRQIGSDLAIVTQLEAILGGYIRQASMLEEHLYEIMESYAEAGHPEDANPLILGGVDRLAGILKNAVKNIDGQIYGAHRISDREAWLWRQVAEGDQEKSPQ